MNFNQFLNESNEWNLKFNLGKIDPVEFQEWAGEYFQRSHKVTVTCTGTDCVITGKGNDRNGSSMEWVMDRIDKAWTINKVIYESKVNENLSASETKKVAETLAKAISKHDGCKCTVNTKTLEDRSFDLDVNGEEFDGGSYYINDKGEVVNAAVTPHEVYGTVDSSVEDFIKGLKKPIKESVVTEAKGFKNTKDFEDFLEEIDGMPESLIKKIMGKDYIDTPGFYADEADDYDGVEDFMLSNMGSKEFEKLKAWWKKNVQESFLDAYDEESEEVDESKITLKRRYTENHPAVVVGKAAKIRNKVLEAIKDGKISQVEFDNLLKEMTTDSKRWLKRNAQHFNVSEDGISLSKSGKAILKNVMVSEATEKAPKIWVPGGFDKAISKYPNSKITRKIVLDAAVKWDVDPEDAIKYVEYGWAIDLDENKNTKDMKTKFIYESFSEFVENKLNEGTLNEAFASAKLASLLTGANAMPKDLPKAFYTMSQLALDKIQDVDIIEMDPEAAKKEKRSRAVYFYFTTNEKPNPYSPTDYYTRNIPANTLLAITDGTNEWMNVEWQRNGGKSLKVTKRDDSAGISKSSANANYGSRISSMKQVAELADRAYCLDLDILRARYSTASLKSERDAAKRGAIAFQTDKDFKAENLRRYNEILAQKASTMPIDQVVLDAIETLTTQIKDALAKGEKGKYGELIVGLDPKGREIKMNDAANLMRNVLDEYSRYVGDVAQSEKEVAAGYGSTYYDNSLKQRSKNIMDYMKKIESKNYAW